MIHDTNDPNAKGKVAKQDDSDRKWNGEADITELYFVLDRSGSMGHLVRATIVGFNEMLAKQRKAARGDLFVSTVLFGDTSEVLHSHVPVGKIRPLTEAEYRIEGCTALLDALGDAIVHAVRHQRHAPAYRRARNVVFVIITDGLENASQRFTVEQVRQLVERETHDYDWEFLYLGANIDAFAAAGAIGIDKSRAVNWVADAVGVQANFTDLSDAVTMTRTNSAAARRRNFDQGAWKKRAEKDFLARGNAGRP